jgi:putative Mg2+ transporter-C (MgtC) family protein
MTGVLSIVTPTWQSAFSQLLQLGIAYLLALPIGWNREREDRSAGLRTFPIVAVAACGFAILGTSTPGATSDTYSRILQGLITGIGFIGGGVILHDKGTATGMATAASIWSIGIVGAAVGFGQYHIAVGLTLLDLMTFKLLTPLKRQLDAPPSGPVAASTAPRDSAAGDEHH